ncbi:MAG: hypothetical protein FVQ80_08070 [Planctomycetes bacterium]|nr:hypothetical protein [Planctomycetota bacterium]
MGRWTKSLFFSIALVLAFSFSSEAAEQTPRLKALIVTGQSGIYHDWQVSTPVLGKMLEETGLFAVDVAVSPGEGHDMSSYRPEFADYNVVVLDYNGDSWPEQTKTDFVEYVSNGGGVVVFHAANNAFTRWREYNQIIGLGGWGGRNESAGPMVRYKNGQIIFDASPGNAGEHGPAHEFQIVNRNTEHPITKGLPEKWMHAKDELYAKLRGPAENLTILSTAYSDPDIKNQWAGGSGEDEPVLFTIEYGKGRTFHTTLGHAKGDFVSSIESVGFIVTFQRGAEWAATGDVTQKVPVDFPTDMLPGSRKGYGILARLDDLLDAVSGYKYGQSLELFFKVSEIIRAVNDSAENLKQVERKFIAVLRSEASFEAKQFICQKLSEIGTEDSVDVLAGMLTEEKTSNIARFALERIEGARVDEALRGALKRASGETKVGIIATLGRRRDINSVTEFGKLIYDSDSKIALAAASALGQIANIHAGSVLADAKEKTQGDLQIVVLDAYLRCAEGLIKHGKTKQALDIYNQLYTQSESVQIRGAALRGKILTDRANATDTILGVLASHDQPMQAVAIRAIDEIQNPEITRLAAVQLAKLPPASQVQLIWVLSKSSDKVALGSVIKETKNVSQEVRLAALRGLAISGDASVVKLLSQRASVPLALEQQTARESLYRLKGPNVDAAILASIAKATPQVKLELVKSVGKRYISDGVEVILAASGDDDRKVRIESLKALPAIAAPKYMPELIGCLVNVQSQAERREAEKTLVAVCNKIPDLNKRSAEILKTLPNLNDNIEVRISLLNVLGKVGDPQSLGVLRQSLIDENAEIQKASIRALSEWPTAEPAADLLKIAETSGNKVYEVLAMRGYIRLVSLADEVSDAEKVQMYNSAMTLAWSSNEKMMVLSGLGNLSSLEALKMASSYLGDETLGTEAEAAVIKIAQKTYTRFAADTKRALLSVLEVSKNDSVIQKANKLKGELKKHEGFISRWLVSQPYARDNVSGVKLFDVAFGPEKDDTKEVRWRVFESQIDEERPWLIELTKAVGGDNAVVYLRNKIWSDKVRKVRLELGSDDGIKVWLNGKLVHSNNAARAAAPAQDVVEVEFKEGFNSLMLKITNGSGGCGACVRITEADGDIIESLDINIED